MFSILDSTFPFQTSLCLSVSPHTNSFAFICYYIKKIIETSEKVLFLSFRDVFDTYKNALRRHNLNWQNVHFYNTLPSLNLIESFDAVIIDGAYSLNKELVSLIEKALERKLLISVTLTDEVLVHYLGRRCNNFLQITSLSTGLSSEYDGCISSRTGEEYLFKFGDQSLAFSRKIK